MGLVQHVDALPVDRDAYGGARWCARRVSAWGAQSDRGEDRAVGYTGTADTDDRRAQSERRARTIDPHSPAGTGAHSHGAPTAAGRRAVPRPTRPAADGQ